MESTQIDFIPILIQLGVAGGFVAVTIFVSGLLGPKKHSVEKDKNYESGIDSIGNARSPFNVRYFLVAILFVLFDIEVIFMYPWAVNFKEMGASGLWKMGIFLFIVVVGLLYEMKRKALDLDE
ncbi:MAG: NADH-quinone oxidoreductase subunit A [Flavobacteriaceae bacterium]|jgi:NADH-quinone oxidoreductase subunit A|nr:NADH-quinone oxidoreductase subunit A [Flavobacteriaceae bacterium]HTO34783.1 NADH-quinone oxidoreductase subunit A [Flavobacterium sp.]